MERIKASLSKMPWGILSIITLSVILWLTLAPKPLGNESPKLFPGADKFVHGIMFGFFGSMLVLDWQRKHDWQPVSPQRVFLCATFSALLGITIEFAQKAMGLGRGFEMTDIVADIIGAYIFAFLWILLQQYWIKN